MDPYKILGISREAATEEIRKAYRLKAAKYHPDTGGDAWVFQQIEEAYAMLNRETKSMALAPIPEVECGPEIETGKARKTTARHRQRKRKKSKSNEFVGIVGGAVLAIIVGGGFWIWYEDYINQDVNDNQLSKNKQIDERTFKAPKAKRRRPGRGPDRQINQPRPEPRNQPRPNNEPNLSPKAKKPEKTDVAKTPASESFPRLPDPAIDIGLVFRDWKDLGKTYSTTAKLKDVIGDSVVLTKKDGSNVSVPIAQLSAKDRQFVGRLPRKIEVEYGKAEKHLRWAKTIVEFYQRRAKSLDITSLEREFIEDRILQLEQNAKENQVLFDGEFVSLDSIQTTQRRSNQLIDEWYELMLVSNLDPNSEALKLAAKKIDDAKKSDPSSYRADFYLGLARVLQRPPFRDFKKAEKRFEDALEKAESHLAISSDIDRWNTAHILNNLALLAIRDNKLKKAEGLWRKFQDVTGAKEFIQEVAHNIAKTAIVIELSNRDPRRSLLSGIRKNEATFSQWKLDILRADSGMGSGVGWLYLPFVLPDDYQQANTTQLGTRIMLVSESEFHNRVRLFDEMADTACLNCDGFGATPCANKGCVNGMVTRKRQVWGTDPNGIPIPRNEVYEVVCPTCTGKDGLPCWGCRGTGINKH